jgi:hypothetical protein
MAESAHLFAALLKTAFVSYVSRGLCTGAGTNQDYRISTCNGTGTGIWNQICGSDSIGIVDSDLES